MNIKTCLLATAIAITFLCVGFQTVALLQTGTQLPPVKPWSLQIFESTIGGPITPDGDGGDPVDGPGWPK